MEENEKKGYSYNLMLKNIPYHIIGEQKSIPIMSVHPVLTYIGGDPPPLRDPVLSIVQSLLANRNHIMTSKQ